MDHPDSQTTANLVSWFAALLFAHRDQDAEREQTARRELRRLGIDVLVDGTVTWPPRPERKERSL